MTDIYYLVRKEKDKKLALSFIEDIIQFIDIVAVDKKVIFQALASDFEDAIQNFSAIESGITHIVTRNLKDYQNSHLEIISSMGFVQKYLL